MTYEIPGIEKVDHYERGLQQNIQQAVIGMNEIRKQLIEANAKLGHVRQELSTAESDFDQSEEHMVILRAHKLRVRDQESVVRGLHLLLDGLKQSHTKHSKDLNEHRKNT